jgi:hypothetical protein
MRPEKLFREMDLASLEARSKGKMNRFKKLLPELKRIYPKYAKENGDYRTGHQTYGYDDLEKIRWNLFYISDRWNCAFRIRWLIDGIENGKISESISSISTEDARVVYK